MHSMQKYKKYIVLTPFVLGGCAAMTGVEVSTELIITAVCYGHKKWQNKQNTQTKKQKMPTNYNE